MASTRRFTFSSAHWMVNWVLGNSSIVWSTIQPAATTGLADYAVLVIRVANCTD
jgi:hypothetical protein